MIVQDGSGNMRGDSGRVGGHSGRSGMGQGTYPEARDGSG